MFLIPHALHWPPSASDHTRTLQVKFRRRRWCPSASDHTRTLQVKFRRRRWCPSASDHTRTLQVKFRRRRWCPSASDNTRTKCRQRRWCPSASDHTRTLQATCVNGGQFRGNDLPREGEEHGERWQECLPTRNLYHEEAQLPYLVGILFKMRAVVPYPVCEANKEGGTE